MKFRKKKKCSSTFVSFTNFKGIQGFYTKFQAISRVQGTKNNFQAFQGFQGALATLIWSSQTSLNPPTSTRMSTMCTSIIQLQSGFSWLTVILPNLPTLAGFTGLLPHLQNFAMAECTMLFSLRLLLERTYYYQSQKEHTSHRKNRPVTERTYRSQK